MLVDLLGRRAHWGEHGIRVLHLIATNSDPDLIRMNSMHHCGVAFSVFRRLVDLEHQRFHRRQSLGIAPDNQRVEPHVGDDLRIFEELLEDAGCGPCFRVFQEKDFRRFGSG